MSENEIADFLSCDAFVGLLAGLEPTTEKVLKQATTLKTISRVGVGMENIDLKAAEDLKINVYCCNLTK